MIIDQRLAKSLEFYNLACGVNTHEDVNRIKKTLNTRLEIPLQILGLLREFCEYKPQYYWKRAVADEVDSLLQKLYLEDSQKFLHGFENATTEFFESVRAYENISKTILEIRTVAFDEGFKTRIFRNPTYAQICEDFLMNLYRMIKSIINEFSQKDYSNLNTLGQIVPCLVKNGFTESTSINLNLRNAINHGNVFVNGNTIDYRYGNSPKNYQKQSISYWEYDNLIDEGYDIGCGILVGILRTIVKNPQIIEISRKGSEYNAFNWFRLLYKNPKLSIAYLDKGKIDSPQLNVNAETTIEEYNSLVFALIELARGTYMCFPDYERYFVGYIHNRSMSGFVRLTKEQLSKSDHAAELYQMVIDNQEVLSWPILEQEINENAFKFHVFKKIKSDDYEVLDIKDCSIADFKRIKATVILTNRIKKSAIKRIISEIVDQMVKLITPQNPYDKTKNGEVEADMIFLNIFLNNSDRGKFNLFPNNPSFVGLAHFYRDKSCPRLNHGGVIASLWNEYHKDKIGDTIELAWNPKYKSPFW